MTKMVSRIITLPKLRCVIGWKLQTILELRPAAREQAAAMREAEVPPPNTA